MIDCNFVVDSTNGNGLGIRNLKGPGVSNVYMKTSATKAVGSPGGTTGPAAGLIYIQLSDCYNRYFGGFSGFSSPVGSSTKVDNSALTIGQAYTIIIVGNSTLAQWQQIGLPIGVAPAVGVTFIAAAIGITGEANTSTSRVAPPSISGIVSIEVVGDPNQTIFPQSAQIVGGSSGSYLIVQCLAATNSSTTTLIPTAPANGTVVGMSFYLSSSSIMVQGE